MTSSDIKAKLKQKLHITSDTPRQQIIDDITAIIKDENIALSRSELYRLADEIMADTFGYGVLQPLLDDPDVTEIVLYSPHHIWTVNRGVLRRQTIQFVDAQATQIIMNRLLQPSGIQLDDVTHHAHVKVPVPNGYLDIAVVKTPIALSGISATIHKFQHPSWSLEELIRMGLLPAPVGEFLRACIQANLTMLISGHVQSGKTSLINALAHFLPKNERLVVIEQYYETILTHEQVFRLQPSKTLSMIDLMLFAHHLHPERIICGDIVGAEADVLFKLLAFVNAGLFSVRADSTRDALGKLRLRMQLAGNQLPAHALDETLGAHLDIIIHVGRLHNGQRKILSISEIQGVEQGQIQLVDIFEWQASTHELVATGLRPRNMQRLESTGINLPENLFKGQSPSR